MAQDFGDDMGNALLNFVTRQTENYLRFGRGRERAFDWWQRHYKKEGNTPEAAKAMAEKQSSREQVVVPFGTSEEAAYYAQVCRENGTYAAAYTDKQGNGFLAFAKEDAKTVAGYAPQFKDVMARLDEQRITDALNHAEPVNKKTMDSLTELTGYPDLPAEDVTVIPVTIRYKDAPDKTYDVLFSEQDTENLNIDDSTFFSGYSHKELTEMVGRETHEDFDVIAVSDPYKVHATQVKTDAPEKTYDAPGKDAPARSDKVSTLRAEDTAIHTQNIRNAAQKAREDCTDFSDFERKMNAQGFGVTETNKGYDFSILPQELKYSKEETEDVLDHLQNKNQRLYVFTGLVYTYAESKEALDTQVLRIISTARQNSIELDTYDYRQRQGLNSILPLGHNHVEISRMFTTAQISILVPFATQELDDAGGNFYGQNKHSRNLVVCNRKKLTSPMGFVCGKTGSGKGMFTKTEMTGTIFSNPTDEIYVIDRAGEYTAIAERYGGSTYHFGVGTGTHLNPFDTVSVEHMTRNEQIAFKVDAMLAQAGASAAEAGSNFSEVDQSLVQRCTELAFQKAAERGDNLPPTLQDFYDAANEQPEEQAQVIALRYERFVKGSMNFFNHQSNVDFNTRIVDFNLKDLPDSMLVFALINVCEAVRNRMYFNAKRNVRTWLYVEEMQSMFAYPTVLNYFSRFSNEGRKFGLLLTGISQNATAMLANEAARNIVLNADFLMLLKQSPLDRMKWAELLNLSEQEEECIDESAEPGDGLLIAGNARVPIRGKFPSGNVLYDLFSTNPNETKKTGLGNKKDAKPVI